MERRDTDTIFTSFLDFFNAEVILRTPSGIDIIHGIISMLLAT